MFHELTQIIITFLHSHPHTVGIITFFVVFCEAMAVIGVVIPGTVTMSAIGVLIGSGVIPATSTFIWAIFGAITGDELSYLLGVYYKDRLHRMWPFKKHPALLEHGEKFFQKHGGKSVIIGRFVGPMRAMIPMVAGMLKMPQRRFLVAAIPSASLWAILYILPGTLLGALSLELPPKVATQFLLAAMATIIAIWLLTWLAQHFCRQIWRLFDMQVKKLWYFLHRYQYGRWFLLLLEDPHEPDHHQQLTLLISAIITGALFLLFLFNVINSGPLTLFNQSLYHLLYSFRLPRIDRVMVVFTLLGESRALLVAVGVFAFWLIWQRRWYALLHWLFAAALAFVSVSFFKSHVVSLRPDILLGSPSVTYSFPSGHVTLSLVILGFFAVLLTRAVKAKWRWLPYAIVSFLVLGISFSRLYLGAHWLTDICGAIFLGLTIVLLITISYKRRHIARIRTKIFPFISIIIFLVVWIFYGVTHFQEQLTIYTPHVPTQIITLQDWQSQKKLLPLYRTNRFGHPIQALNIEWLGSLNVIEDQLTEQGWQSYAPSWKLLDLLHRFYTPETKQPLPLLPQLFNNRHEALLLVKNTPDPERILILRLWRADIEIVNSHLPFWLGTIEYYKSPHHKLLNLHSPINQVKFTGAISDLIPFLKNFSWKMITIASSIQPLEIQDLDWNGKVLLIWSARN